MLQIIILMLIGMAVFFCGLYLGEKGLVLGNGDRLKRTLQMFTSNIFAALLTGTIVTAITQSSSAVSVIVIGFVSGGVMNLYQAMGVILGANIGTTMTMHILALNITNLQWWLLAIGVLGMILGKMMKKDSQFYAGVSTFGFGLIFLGLAVLQAAVEPLQYDSGAVGLFAHFGTQPLLALVVGTLFTAIIQSSGVTSGIVLVLARQGMINLPGAIAIILGANVGTCATALLAAIRASSVARAVAYFHVLYNVLGVLMFIPLLPAFTALVSMWGNDLGYQIALAQTVFNVVTAILILPFLRPIERLLLRQAK